MPRLIDADALIAEYDRVHIGEPGKARKLIEDAPTVEPERTGKWNCSDDMYESAVCSACGWDTAEPWDHIRHWFKFCPNCGARMEQ